MTEPHDHDHHDHAHDHDHHHHDHAKKPPLADAAAQEDARSRFMQVFSVITNSARALINTPLSLLASPLFNRAPGVQNFANNLRSSTFLSSPWYAEEAKLGYGGIAGLAGMGALGAIATGTVLKDAPSIVKKAVNLVTTLPMIERILGPDWYETSGLQARLHKHDEDGHDHAGHAGHQHGGQIGGMDIPDFAMNSATGALWTYGLATDNSKFLFSSSLLTALFAGSGATEDMVMARSEALEALKQSLPSEAMVLADGKMTARSSDTLKPGDVVMVRAGENLPADGIVRKVDGNGFVNTQMHTGDELDTTIPPGSPILQGTVVKDGVYTVELTATPMNSRLQGLIERIEGAEKASLEGSFEKWTDRYVLGALLPAAATQFLLALKDGHGLGKAIERTLQLIVKGAPCPLGAAPLVRKATTGKLASEEGIYVNDHQKSEQLPNVKRVYFDIVGTLTDGELQVLGAPPAFDLDGNPKAFSPAMLERLGMAETLVNHPNARAIVDYAKSHIEGFAYNELRDNNGFEADPQSRGMSAIFDGRTVVAGRPDYVQEKAGRHRLIPESVTAQMNAMEAAHQKPVLLFDSEEGWAVMGFANKILETARPTVDALKAMGLEVGIITGSSTAYAQEIARQLGIDPSLVHSNATGSEKEAILDRDKAAGNLPGFVGDALNDSEAVKGHLSFAIDSGSDVTKTHAAVVTPGIESIPPLLRLFKNLNSQVKLMYGGAATWMTGLIASHPFIDMDTGIAAVAHESPTLGLTVWSAGVQPARNMETFRAERDALVHGKWDEVIAGNAKDQQQTQQQLVTKNA